MNDNITKYKGFEIEYNFYDEGEYSVQYEGDDLVFGSVEEAKHFIDEVSPATIVFTVSEHADDMTQYTIETDNEEWNDASVYMNFDNIYYTDLFSNMRYIAKRCKDKFGCDCRFIVK